MKMTSMLLLVLGLVFCFAVHAEADNKLKLKNRKAVPTKRTLKKKKRASAKVEVKCPLSLRLKYNVTRGIPGTFTQLRNKRVQFHRTSGEVVDKGRNHLKVVCRYTYDIGIRRQAEMVRSNYTIESAQTFRHCDAPVERNHTKIWQCRK